MLGEGVGQDKMTWNRMMFEIDNKNKDLYTNSPYCMKVD